MDRAWQSLHAVRRVWQPSTETQVYFQPALPVEPVDTMGAGDSAIAAFMLSYLAGAEIPHCLETAATFAAQTCRVAGSFGYGVSYER